MCCVRACACVRLFVRARVCVCVCVCVCVAKSSSFVTFVHINQLSIRQWCAILKSVDQTISAVIRST